MDYLIKKSDQSVAQQWSGTTAKVKLPGQSGGDVVFTGDKRPLDLGDYVLVKAVEVDELLNDTKKRGDITTVVNGETVTVTRTAINKTVAELAMEEIHRLEALETPRGLAESVLIDEGKAWLTSNRDKIATERGKL